MNYDSEDAMSAEINRLQEENRRLQRAIDDKLEHPAFAILEVLELLGRLKVAQLEETKNILAGRIEALLRRM